MKNLLAYISFFLIPGAFWAQTDSLRLHTLQPVFLDVEPLRKALDDSVYVFTDSTVHAGAQTLRDQIFLSTSLQIREYGNGMTAGISMRGASPSHTQVVWNGIPLNSPLNGQTDLNTLSILLADRLQVYRGGMSMLYGSGAMAGAVVLENRMWAPAPPLLVRLGYGAFGKRHMAAKFRHRQGRWAGYAGGDFLNDANRFRIPEKNYVNRHARRLQYHYNAGLGYRSDRTEWRLEMFRSRSDRLLPGTLTTSSAARLLQDQNRYVFTAESNPGTAWQWTARLAHTDESYTYFHTGTDVPSGRGKAVTRMAIGEVNYALQENRHWFAKADLRRIDAESMAFGPHVRTTLRLLAGAGGRKGPWQWETAAGALWYRRGHSPLTGFVYGAYRPDKRSRLSLNLGSNYRLPSFNDLYWQPGGNPSLLPERNYEAEAAYRRGGKHAYVRAAFFYRINRNLIRWKPAEDGLWHPVNILSTSGYGAEWDGKYRLAAGRSNWCFSGHYVWQRIRNDHTGKRLSYTPEFLWNLSAEWSRRFVAVGLSHRFQSFFYTDDLNRSYLHGHRLWNAYARIGYGGWQLTAGVDNIFNRYYELMPGRPMPGRYFYSTLQYIWK